MLSDSQFKKLFPFDVPRVGQRELIQRILEAYKNGKKHIVLNAPTGIGKSAVSYFLSRFFKSSYILTSQKVLQQQYKRQLDIPYIMGKGNYICNKNNKFTCDLGDCKGQMTCKVIDCPYKSARQSVMAADISNFNYSYFMTVNRNADQKKRLPQRNLLVFDECHNLQNFLINSSTISITKNMLMTLQMNYVKLPFRSIEQKQKMVWLQNVFLKQLYQKWQSINSSIQNASKWKFQKQVKIFNYKRNVVGQMIDAAQNIIRLYLKENKIVIIHDQNGITYKPLFGNSIFNFLMRPYAKRFLYMSATILDKRNFCSTIGLPPDQVEYIQCQSIFPIKNRPIYYQPVGSMTMQNKVKTIPKMIQKIKEIMDKYPNQKGIIHTVNYQLANTIIDQLWGTDNGSRLLKPQGKNRKEILQTFKYSKNPYVLISPSLTEGLDLKDDLSRFCIICKVPYPTLGDEWIKIRMKNDSKWYAIKTAETLIQMTGRSIRTESDHADTYILDSNFQTFATNYSFLFPKWWQDSVLTK